MNSCVKVENITTNYEVFMDQMILKSKEVREFFGIGSKTLSNWKAAGCPQVAYGKWDLKAVFDWWWETHAAERAAAESGDESTNEAKRLYWWEKARGEKLKNDTTTGDLIPREQIAKEWAGRMGEAAAGVSALSDRLPPLLEGKEQGDMWKAITGEMGRLRDHYARRGRFCPAPKTKRRVKK